MAFNTLTLSVEEIKALKDLLYFGSALVTKFQSLEPPVLTPEEIKVWSKIVDRLVISIYRLHMLFND